MSRIVFLHAIAVIITAICMPLALYWFLNSEVENLQRRAMREQTDSLAQHLSLQSDGRWSLDLPAGLRDLYSEAYGRYAYAVLDDAGRVLFSSRKDLAPVFPSDDRAAPIEFLEARRSNRIISGMSSRKEVGDRFVWVQVAEDLAHRDVIVDDILANFFQRV